MQRLKPEVDIVKDILEAVLAAQPDSSFTQSLLQQYVERGGLSKKQLQGLYGKAQKIKAIPAGKLATLEAIILRKNIKYRSPLPENRPLYEKDERIGKMIEDILQKFPTHKRVLLFKTKYDSNETLNAAEITELENSPNYFSNEIEFRCWISIAPGIIFSCNNGISKTSAREQWVDLFNGKDINDWIVKINHHETGDNYGNTFRVEDGMIKVRYDQYDSFNERFGHLFYKTPYSHFKLIVEYRFTGEFRKDAPGYANLNSGVMFHSQDPHTILKEQNWPISIEFQFNAGLGDGKPRPTGSMCSPGTNVVYKGKLDETHCITSSSRTFDKDEWVKAELVVYGDSSVSHIINGDTVLQYSKPQIGGNVVKGFDPAIKIDGKLLKEGFIALQSEGQPIDFRKVQLLNLKN